MQNWQQRAKIRTTQLQSVIHAMNDAVSFDSYFTVNQEYLVEDDIYRMRYIFKT